MLLYMYGIRWTLAYLSWNCLSLTSTSTESLAPTIFILHLLNNPPQDLMNKSFFHYGSNAIIEYSLPIRLISHHTWPVTLTTDPARIVHDFHTSFANSLACPIFSWFHLSRIYFTPWCVQYFHDFISRICFTKWAICRQRLYDSIGWFLLILSNFTFSLSWFKLPFWLTRLNFHLSWVRYKRRFVLLKFNLSYFDSLESISFSPNINRIKSAKLKLLLTSKLPFFS